MCLRKTRFPTSYLSAILALLLGSLAAPGIAAWAQAPAVIGNGRNGPDSSTVQRDPFLTPTPVTVGDSGETPPPHDLPPHAEISLSAQGSFTSAHPRVGDSLDYVVQVEWEDTQIPVFVLAPDSLDFPGFKLLGQATAHKKLATGSSVKNRTEFIYRLRAATQGTGKASSLKVRYLTGLSRQEEAVFTSTALTDIAPAAVRMLGMLWFRLLLWAAIAAGAGALAYAAFKLASRRRSITRVARDDLKPDVTALKTRLRSAQNSPDASKAILLEMESLARRFLNDEMGADESAPKAGPPPAVPGSSATRFDPLLDIYLARKAAVADVQDWDKLRELFRHARFAGGYKEPHELQDAFRTFRKCLKMTGDDDHE